MKCGRDRARERSFRFGPKPQAPERAEPVLLVLVMNAAPLEPIPGGIPARAGVERGDVFPARVTWTHGSTLLRELGDGVVERPSIDAGGIHHHPPRRSRLIQRVVLSRVHHVCGGRFQDSTHSARHTWLQNHETVGGLSQCQYDTLSRSRTASAGRVQPHRRHWVYPPTISSSFCARGPSGARHGVD